MLTVSGFVSSENTGMLLGALNELGTFLGAARASTLSDSLLFSRHEFQDTGAQRIRDIKDRSNLKDKIAMSDTVTNTRTLHVRKGNILEVLRGGRDLGIVDIASNLPEYSAKMIQRDLAELVAEGTVKKTGLKRWSRYMIAS